MRQIPLQETANRALDHVTELLRTGFTGRIVLVCNKGGVKQIDQSTVVLPSALEETPHIHNGGARRVARGG